MSDFGNTHTAFLGSLGLGTLARIFRAVSFKKTRCPWAFFTNSPGIVQKCDFGSMSCHRICRSSPPRCAVTSRSRNQAHTYAFCVAQASHKRRISLSVSTRSRVVSFVGFLTMITGFAVGATSRCSAAKVRIRETSAPNAGQNVGVTQVGEHIWLATFMHYDLGYFDDETG